jgi:SWI/SNF-related matrix-associated actin-dependent regulator of chromatin subfamily A-like protein 1
MPFIKNKCSFCHKTAEAEKEFEISGKTVLRLKCGHIVQKEHLRESSPEQLISLDGKSPYKFQCEGIRFAENSSGRCLIADEMGLGKTIQALGLIALHKEMQPFLAIVKSSLKTQWQRETMRWIGEESFAQIIESARDHFIPGMTGYIISYDLLRRFVGKTKVEDTEDISEDKAYGVVRRAEIKVNSLIDTIKKLKIKTIILDECQQIKNTQSQRTVEVRDICREVDHVIALSGTPIKNNASEYFPVLNILKPEIFPTYSKFLLNDCDSYFNGYSYKTAGLRNPERFAQKTKSFIIRRTRDEVMPDLPKIARNFQFCDLAKEVEKAYIDTFKQFRDEYNSGNSNSFEESSNILAFLSKMRHLTGLSKINPVIDQVIQIMGSTNDRVTIFVHHQDVAEILINKLNSLFKELDIPPCARHQAGSSALETEKNFEKSRVLVCSTLAGGEGLNLQKLCFRFIMMERQWNPANEEQAESRFPRPEGLKVESIEGTYFVAVGTVDEFFSEIVERKREWVGKTLDGKAVQWDQSSLIKELSETLAVMGGKKWSI